MHIRIVHAFGFSLFIFYLHSLRKFYYINFFCLKHSTNTYTYINTYILIFIYCRQSKVVCYLIVGCLYFIYFSPFLCIFRFMKIVFVAFFHNCYWYYWQLFILLWQNTLTIKIIVLALKKNIYFLLLIYEQLFFILHIFNLNVKCASSASIWKEFN